MSPRPSIVVSLALVVAMSTSGQVHAQSVGPLDQPISLDLRDVSLEDALQAVSDRTRLQLVYSTDDLPAQHRISLRLDHATVRDALQLVLRATGLEIVVSPTGRSVLVRPVRAGTIEGRVLDDSTSEALDNASVAIVGTSLGTGTDSGGTFRIEGVPAGANTIHVRRLGYRPADTTITTRGASRETLRVTVRLHRVPATLQQVLVHGQLAERRTFDAAPNVGTFNLSASAMRSAPAAIQPDVLRAVQLLPGVVARSDFSAGYNVEGGESDQNLVLLDGIPIFNPFHLGGLFGTFIDGAVDRADLIEAGFPARFGGRLSSVLDVASTEESRGGVHGSVETSLLSTSGAVGGGFDGGSGTWDVAARRTYADAIARTFTSRVLPYHFQDVQGRAVYALPWGTRLSVTGFSGVDVLDGTISALRDSTAPGAGVLDFHWGNDVAGVTIAQPIRAGGGLFGDSTVLEQRISSSHFSSTFDIGTGA
ncbi:MAG TPA: carboxypeptidase-like regulatory domain-containing protein, partial [Vicinamibacterales bacterium]|nr:carboxypeptidase-like regulatory domain-containing protein [Vicinamibacterales bacterium]